MRPTRPGRARLPEEGDTCPAPVKELDDEGAELCGEQVTQRRLFCGMMIPYCDDHAAEIDEVDAGEKGNE